MARGRRRPELQRDGQVRCRFCGGFYDPALPECPNCGYETEQNQNYTTDWRTIGTEDCAGGFGGPKSHIQRAAKWLGGLLIGLLLVVAVLNIGEALQTIQLNANVTAASSSVALAQTEPAASTNGNAAAKSTQKNTDQAEKKDAAQKNTKADTKKKQSKKDAEKAEADKEKKEESEPLTLNAKDITLMRPDDAYRMVADGGGGYYTWASGNSAIAKVDDGGVITAVGNGTTIVTCTTASGETAECRVHVSYG